MSATTETLLWALVAAALASTALVPAAAALFRRLGAKDAERSLRKIHAGEIPRAGGIAVIAVVLCAAAAVSSMVPLAREHWGVLAGATLVGVAGLVDDVIGLRARTKLLVQVAAACIPFAFGLHWHALEALFDRNWVSAVLTVGYFVTAVNAVNLVDGLDGLAGGVTALSFSVVVGAGMLGAAPPDTALLSACAAGAMLGFLAHNRHPAKVFLGDGGAYFLGMFLAGELLLVGSVRPRKPIVELAIPLMALALPLLDTWLAVLRRLFRGQPIAASDADHLHHRLLSRGLGAWGAVGILWLAAAWFAAMALLTVAGVGGSATLAGALAMALGLSAALGYVRPGGDPRAGGWRTRRRALVEALRELDAVERGGQDRGPERWRRMAPQIEGACAAVGAVGFEVRGPSGEAVVRGGRAEARVYLVIPLSGGAELRLGVAKPPEGVLSGAESYLVERLLAVMLPETAAADRRGPQRAASSRSSPGHARASPP